MKLNALWGCAREAEQMEPSSPVSFLWDPMNEASPFTSLIFQKAAREAGREFSTCAFHCACASYRAPTQSQVWESASRQLHYSSAAAHDASSVKEQPLNIYLELLRLLAFPDSQEERFLNCVNIMGRPIANATAC